MAEPVIPQKRTIEDEVKLQEQFQSGAATPIPGQKPLRLTINKFQPYISYKPIDFVKFEPSSTESTRVPGFKIIEDIPLNTRKGFQYSPCSPNPYLPILKFGTTDLPPFKPSLSLFDRSTEIALSEDLSSASTGRGWVSSRVDVAVSEGKVYWEFNIIRSNEDNHVRIGIGRREASIEAPVGFDGYGYGIRDKTGQTLHLSRLKNFMDGGFRTGDVIGMILELPKCEFKDIVRDQIAIRYKQRLFWEKFDYVSTNKMEHLLNPVIVFGERAIPDLNPWKPEFLEGSSLKIYKNGQFIGIAFDNLYDFYPPNSELKTNSKKAEDILKNNGTLGYYPTVSVFKGGIAEINAGPDFKFKPKDEDNLLDLYEIYNQRIADDIVWDIVDEIEAEFIQSSNS